MSKVKKEEMAEVIEIWRRSVSESNANALNVAILHLLRDNEMAAICGAIVEDVRRRVADDRLEETGGWVLPAIIAGAMDDTLKRFTRGGRPVVY
jgi:hypothetical protein